MNKESVLFETSWEVCNKVGGIFTVIRSKLKEASKEFGDDYYLIGPVVEENTEFKEENNPINTDLKNQISLLGVKCRIGRWNVEPFPRVILIEFKNVLDQNKLLYDLWEDYGVDSMTGGWDYIEPVLFSTVAGMVINSISKNYGSEYKIFAHFHEWMTGAGLLYLDRKNPSISTVFTTHATVLGRSLAGNGIDLYNVMQSVDNISEASRYNVTAKHSIESVSARLAGCFTTVSDITAEESKYMLKTAPPVVCPNGFNVSDIPEYIEKPDYFNGNKQKLLGFASEFLNKDFKFDETVILSTSGRYEFRNKGIDLLIDSLGKIKRENRSLANKKILVYFFIITGMIKISPDEKIITKYMDIATHPLWDAENDPIARACRANDLVNSEKDNINIIFVPTYLNGKDGLLNMDYYEALSGCDLTIYPSYYEPWGYTPLESIAHSVPTVSTDVAGFGKWITASGVKSDGVYILKRSKKGYEELKDDLCNIITDYVHVNQDEKAFLRNNVRDIALKAEWSHFFANYKKAYKKALKELENKADKLQSIEYRERGDLVYKGSESLRPRFRQFSVKTRIPEALGRLRELAYNLWWVWSPEARELFSRLDPVLYDKLGNNPVKLIEKIEPEKLNSAAENQNYLNLYNSVMNDFDAYMKAKKSPVPAVSAIKESKPVAYFSMEFGMHECLPIYSGGLGILSGDHIKSSSDLNIKLLGIGLMYKHGYFRQRIDKEGHQVVEYFHNDFFSMPLTEVSRNGKKLMVSVNFPGRTVFARVWEAAVGRVSVYFLDTDIPENSPNDREITGKLYGGDRRTRIEQEILLGIGGVRLLAKLGIEPGVYHLNEGHSAFLIIERAINLTKYKGLSFAAAREVIKSSTVFTTHTPVEAGNESFDMQLIVNYLKSYTEENGLSWDNLCDLGHKNFCDNGSFKMTVLALRNSMRNNGVSHLHGIVSRKMWKSLWPGFLMEEVPIGHITNGVHAPTWLAKEFREVLTRYCGTNLNEDLLNESAWAKIESIPDDIIWNTHITLKNLLFNYIKEKITQTGMREGEDPYYTDKFLMNVSSTPLTIGFARRFATYKRAVLFLNDFERFKRLLLNKQHPVQFVFAGKAHPNDPAGADLIREIVHLSKQEEFIGKIVFVEGYDMRLARRLVSGVDVWLNNPKRPMEASGTSGQKAGMNGVINLSVSDGWWEEGFNGKNGWIFGSETSSMNSETQDKIDCDSLYDLLEQEIIPTYYFRNNKGVPERWIQMMKNSIFSVLYNYNTNRMIKDYCEKMYVPAVKKHELLAKDNFKAAKDISEWKKSVQKRFGTMHIKNIKIEGIKGDNLSLGQKLDVYIILSLGDMKKDEILPQLVVIEDRQDAPNGYEQKADYFNDEVYYESMSLVEEKDNLVEYHCIYKSRTPGKFNYGIRVLPYHEQIDDFTDVNLVYWA